MKTNVTLAILALLQGISYGDIYDTKARVEKKYGEAVEVDGHTRVYHWKGYRVECTMFQWKPEVLQAIGLRPQEEPNCVSEKITRLDGRPLTTLDLRAILPTSIVGGQWTQRDHNEWSTQFARARTTMKNSEVVIRARGRE